MPDKTKHKIKNLLQKLNDEDKNFGRKSDGGYV